MSRVQQIGLKLRVNGRAVSAEIPAELKLLDFLRDHLRLTGAKLVCGEGECGACTVMMDGKVVNSCLILAVEADGCEITTIEGLETKGKLTALQEAFVEKHAVQCGYCIPGMILTGESLIAGDPGIDRAAIHAGLSGNICRCTGYHKIVDAIAEAAERSK